MTDNIINMLNATNRIISQTGNLTERERLIVLRTKINVMTSVANLLAIEAEEDARMADFEAEKARLRTFVNNKQVMDQGESDMEWF